MTTTSRPRRLLPAILVPAVLFLGACSTDLKTPEAADVTDEVPDSLPMTDGSSTTSLDGESTTEPTTVDATSTPTKEPSATEAPQSTTAPASAVTTVETTAPTSPVPATEDPLPTGGTELEQAEAESFRLLNELRVSVGLLPLIRTPEMDAFARDWSQTMATSGNFEHSTGPYPENIAWTSQSSFTPVQAAAQVHSQWVNSPSHYANMTDTNYATAGIGFYKDASGWHATHVFDR